MIPMLLLASARASTTYPGEVAQAVGSDCVPPCTICHASLAGGAGTVVTPFGESMRDRGLTGGMQTALLTAALDAMAADEVDSDADGALDVDELAGGEDPNGGEPFCELLAPEYGCFNQGRAPAGALATALAVLLARRRRRS